MKKLILSVVTVMAMGTANLAAESMVSGNESAYYVGLGFSASATGNGSLSLFGEEAGQDRTGDVVFQAGYEINPYIAVEGRYSTSLSQGNILERDAWGIYAKPQYPVNAKMSVYGLLGYGGMSLNASSDSGVSLDDNGFQWGIGMSYAISDTADFFIDYTSVANDMSADTYPLLGSNTISSASLTMGVTYKF